jgi:hypothetical protein
MMKTREKIAQNHKKRLTKKKKKKERKKEEEDVRKIELCSAGQRNAILKPVGYPSGRIT